MSVNTSEDYLDELLQAIEPIIQLGEPDPPIASVTETEIMEEVIDGEDVIGLAEDAEAALEINDLLASMTSDETDIIEESDMPEDVESILEAASNQASPEEVTSYDEDVKELLKQFTDDEDLTDIQDILDKNDNGEALDNSMLELPDVEVFRLEEDNEEADDNSDKGKKAGSIGKWIGSVSGLFKKRKNRKSKEINEETITEEGNSVLLEEENEIGFESEDLAGFEFTDESAVNFEDMLGQDVEDLIFDEDLSDIEQLLTGGALVESDESQEKGLNNEKGKKDGKGSKSKKKESFFTKILNALTEEMDEPVKVGDKVPEAGETGVSPENLNILKELSAEDKKRAKKALKEEKKNKKAGKKGKNVSQKGENEEDSGKEQDSKKAKKAKKRKEKLDKKLKPRKVEEITKPERKLPKKRVISTFALCLSILAAVLILQNVVFQSDNLKEAKFAYDNGDYATCFANLETVDRNEEEEKLYRKSLIILSVQRKWDAYNNFVVMDNGVEALNSLLEGVEAYRSQEDLAFEWGVHAQIVVIYQDILEALQGYGLSQTDIDEILGYESKVTYTKRLDSIVNGTPFVTEEMYDNTIISEPQPLQDVLPGEEDFLPEDTTGISDYLTDDSESSGETVVVGSNPVDISTQGDNIDYEEPVVVGGQNVGSGNMDMSIEVSEQNIVVEAR